MSFIDPKAAEKPDEAEKDMPDEEPANPEVAGEINVHAEVHNQDNEDYLLGKGATGDVDEEDE